MISLNLITDPWIPVLTTSGPRVIAPWQITDPAVLRPNWPRADLNVACLELLIGLVRMADPPAHASDWARRRAADPDRLRDRLAAYAPAFNLLGDGPRFMQDRAALEGAANALDMLFLDSAGGQTVRNNADLMVWRDRYPALEPALTAMALYALHAFAPSGGAGNRTSMRGGGPMVTLIQPDGSLWDMIWTNTPDGQPAPIEALPWMRPTVTSETGRQVFPEQAHPVEAFFGMPRRLRLVDDGTAITGVVQRPYGTNYAGWDHPLTPYYRLKASEDWLPKHPRAGLFTYRHWLGVIVGGAGDNALTRRAQVLRDWMDRDGGPVRLLVAGWAMDNMKPRDFIYSTQPLFVLDPMAESAVIGMIEAADQFSLALRSALAPVVAEGEAREALREAFFAETQAAFEQSVQAAQRGEAVAEGWIAATRRVALRLFEARALPGLADRDVADQRAIVQAHRNLRGSFAGYGTYGGKAYEAMMLDKPSKKKEAA